MEKSNVTLIRKPFDYIERKRTYLYKDGTKITFENVVALWEKSDGSGTTHRLETINDPLGNFHIVNSGWVGITLDVDGFTF